MSPGDVSRNVAVNPEVLNYTDSSGEKRLRSNCKQLIFLFTPHLSLLTCLCMRLSSPEWLNRGGLGGLAAFIMSTEKPNNLKTREPTQSLSAPDRSHEKNSRVHKVNFNRVKITSFTFFFIQSEVDVGLPLHTLGEAVKGKQVAFPVVPLKVESPAGTHGK